MNTIQKAAISGLMLIGTVGGGALGASLINGTAGAATNPSTTATTAATSSSTDQQAPPAGNPQRDPSKGGHQANGITEKLLTGDTAAKVEAAALKAVPGGTIERVENDAEGATYEAHMTKADGSEVTVKLDASFKVTETLDGHG